MLRIGQQLRNHVASSPKKGEEAAAEILKTVDLSEAEIHSRKNNPVALSEKRENARELDITELWEGLVGSVRQTCFHDSDWNQTKALMKAANDKSALGLPLSEAEVMSGMFQRLTAAKLFTTMMATYELTPAVFEQLFGTFDSPYREFDHTIPSDAPTVAYVAEGEEYPTADLKDRYCKTKANKFGRIIEITRETMITDRTQQVVQQAEQLAASAKYREDELAALSFQDSSNSSIIQDPSEQDAGTYFPEGTQVALYRTAVGSTKVSYETALNKQTGQNLLHWDNIAAAITLLADMQNPEAGQFIEVAPGGVFTIVVPTGIMHRANLLANMSGGLVDINANAAEGTEFSISRIPDPIRNMGVSQLKVVVWKQLPTAGTASQSTWYLAGNSKLQFRKHQRWPVEFNRASAAQLGGDDFKKDVITKVRAGFNAGFRAVDDKYVIQSTNA